MTNFSKPINRALFVLCVIATGSIAGTFVWAFFFLMDKGIEFFWATLPALIGQAADAYLPGLAEGPFGFLPYPLIVCIGGGLLIGYFDKKTGARPEELTKVMAKVKQDGRYSYEGIGKLSLAALLPLLFGRSIGPEGWAYRRDRGALHLGRRSDAAFRSRLPRTHHHRHASSLDRPVHRPLVRLRGPACRDRADAPKDGESDVDIKLPRAQKTFVYLCAIAGALAAFLLLGDVFGGGMGLPRFTGMEVSALEAALVIPAALLGCAAGWAFHASTWASGKLASRMGERSVAKAVLGGIVLALCGMALPYTMFAGEAQTHLLMDSYLAIGASALIATGLVKAALTPFCIQMGWRGGHFFPLIFSGVSMGYGFSLLTGADPVSCVAACTAGCMGAVMRQPVMTALLLIMCFPVKASSLRSRLRPSELRFPFRRRLRLPSRSERARRERVLRRGRAPRHGRDARIEKPRRQANDKLPHARGRAEALGVRTDYLRVRDSLPHMLSGGMARRPPKPSPSATGRGSPSKWYRPSGSAT